MALNGVDAFHSTLDDRIPFLLSVVTLEKVECDEQNDCLYLWVKVPYIQSPKTKRHHLIDQAFVYWSVLLNCHSSMFPSLPTYAPMDAIPLRVSKKLQSAYLVSFFPAHALKDAHKHQAESLIDIVDLPPGSLLWVWFTLSQSSLSETAPLTHYECRRLYVSKDLNAFEKYCRHPCYFPLHSSGECTLVNSQFLSNVFSSLMYDSHEHTCTVQQLDYFQVGDGISKKRYMGLFTMLYMIRTRFFDRFPKLSN